MYEVLPLSFRGLHDLLGKLLQVDEHSLEAFLEQEDILEVGSLGEGVQREGNLEEDALQEVDIQELVDNQGVDVQQEGSLEVGGQQVDTQEEVLLGVGILELLLVGCIL